MKCKKILSLVFSFLIVASSFAFSDALAADVKYDGYFFAEKSDGLYVIDTDNTVSGSIAIPSSVNGKKVVGIEKNAFSNNNLIHNVDIPDSVKSIGEKAFNNCLALSKVTFSGSFSSLVLSKGVFSDCQSLSNIVFPDCVSIIPDECFKNCISLVTFSIKDSVMAIGMQAFLNCKSFENIYIPASVTSIGSNAFVSCDGCKYFGVSTSNNCYKAVEGCLYTKDGTVLVQYPIGKNAESYSVASTTKRILPYAFKNSKITGISLPEGLNEIGEYCFDSCKSLSSVTVPSTVTSYCYAFISSGLVNAVINSASDVSEYAFSDCRSLKSVKLANGIKFIGLCAFYNCKALESVIIPSSVTEIDSAAFENCTSLGTVHIPSSVSSIYQNAFSGCDSIKVCCSKENSYGWNYAVNHGYSVSVCYDHELVTGNVKIVNNPGTRDLKYGETLIIKADPDSIPVGGHVEWSVSGSGFEKNTSANECRIKATGKGTASVSAVLKDSLGREVSSATETLNLKSNIFLIIIAFFRNIFSDMTIVQ